MNLRELFTRPLFGSRAAAAPVAPEGIHAIRLAADILDRVGYARRAGLTYDGKRDLYDALGYSTKLTAEALRGRYERGDVAARIVEAYPKETWEGGGPQLIEDQDPNVLTPWEEAWEEFAKRLMLWSTLKRADILAGLGAYSAVLLGAAGELSTPLPKLNGLDDVLYLAPYGPDEVAVSEWVGDSADSRFGLPQVYKLKRKTSSVAATGSNADRLVHWTRVLHVADNLLDDRVTGHPLLERVWNRLDDLDKVVGGGAEAFWQRVNAGTIFSVDKDVSLADDKLAALRSQAEEFAHGMRRTIAARGFEAKQLDSDVSTFGDQVSSIMSLVSGATGIPQRILLGSERGELASTQDAEAWTDRIAERRRDFGEPLIVQLLTRLAEHGAFELPEEYEIRWPEYEEMNAEQKATVATKWAKLNKDAGETVVTGAEIREHVLGLEPLDEAEIAEREQARAEAEAEAAAALEAEKQTQLNQEEVA